MSNEFFRLWLDERMVYSCAYFPFEGATLDEAQAELTALGRRAAADFPRTHRHVRPQVMPYARSILNMSSTEALLVGSTNVFLGMLVLLICGNARISYVVKVLTMSPWSLTSVTAGSTSTYHLEQQAIVSVRCAGTEPISEPTTPPATAAPSSR